MPRINLDEDECKLILAALEDAHVTIQITDVNWKTNERGAAIERLEEKIKEAE